MATRGTIIEESIGSLKLLIVPFTAITTSDTWASGLANSGVVSYQFQGHGATETGTAVAYSAGTFTFYNSGVTGAGDLLIYVRG